MNFRFNNQNYKFEPKLFSFVAFFTALIILLSLSTWQIKRLEWKKNLIHQRIQMFESKSIELSKLNNPENFEFQRVIIKGTLINDKEMFMPALSRNGNNGYHIIVPLKLPNNQYVIFDRGWIPLKLKNRELRYNYEISQAHKIEAVIRSPGKKGKFQPDNDLKSNFWFFVEPEKMSEFTEIDFINKFYLEAVNDGPNGYPLGGQTRIYIRNNHLQYAITWFLIALGLIGVYVAANVRRIKN